MMKPMPCSPDQTSAPAGCESASTATPREAPAATPPAQAARPSTRWRRVDSRAALQARSDQSFCSEIPFRPVALVEDRDGHAAALRVMDETVVPEVDPDVRCARSVRLKEHQIAGRHRRTRDAFPDHVLFVGRTRQVDAEQREDVLNVIPSNRNRARSYRRKPYRTPRKRIALRVRLTASAALRWMMPSAKRRTRRDPLKQEPAWVSAAGS